jgi:hypothetical protein
MAMKFALLSFFVSITVTLVGQTTEWKLAYSLPMKMNQAKLDQLNNIYTIHKGEVLKLDSYGKELNRYSNKLIGDDVHIDITNPMKVLLYSPDQMQLFTLDSRLGEMNETINFFRDGYEQISLVATSHSNGMWLYDPINFVLIRLDDKLNEDRRSLNIAQLLRLQLYPTDVIEVNDKVYLTDPAHGVFVFDIFGNYVKKVPIKGIEHLVINDGRMFFIEDQTLKTFRFVDSSIQEVPVDLGSVDFVWLNRNRIVSLNPKGINIYQAIR